MCVYTKKNIPCVYIYIYIYGRIQSCKLFCQLKLLHGLRLYSRLHVSERKKRIKEEKICNVAKKRHSTIHLQEWWYGVDKSALRRRRKSLHGQMYIVIK